MPLTARWGLHKNGSLEDESGTVGTMDEGMEKTRKKGWNCELGVKEDESDYKQIPLLILFFLRSCSAGKPLVTMI